MQIITLQAIPNQAFNIQIDNVLYKISIKVGGDFMFVDIIRNGLPVVLGMRMVAGTFLIPYKYLATFGNFLLATADEEYPYYTQFNVNQFLMYFSEAELEDLNV